MTAEGVFPKSDGDVLFETDIHYASGIIDAEAGETLAAGDVVFIYMSGHANEGEAWLADANVQDKCRVSGICLSAGNDGATVQIMTRGVYKTTGLTAKETYYLSTTAGDWTTTASGVRIGHAVSTTELFVNIVQDDRDVVGTIKPWLQDHVNMIANPLTAFWKLCDGSDINDLESPLWSAGGGGTGQTPLLNAAGATAGRFLKGDTTSDTGTDAAFLGSATHGHSMPAHHLNEDRVGSTNYYAFENNALSSSNNAPLYCPVIFIMKIK